MSVAPSAASTGQPNRFITCPCKSVRYSSLPSLQRASMSTLRYRSLVMCVSINLSDGEQAKNTDSNRETNNQPSAPPASPSPPLPKAPDWLKWTIGSIAWLALPSWKSIHSVQGLLSRVDVTVEAIEAVAEVTEKISSDVAEQLPDGDGLKKVMLGLENASEHVLKEAKMIDEVIDKVLEFEEKIKLEDRKGEEDSKEG